MDDCKKKEIVKSKTSTRDRIKEFIWAVGVGAAVVVFAFKNFASIDRLVNIEKITKTNSKVSTEILVRLSVIEAKIEAFNAKNKKNNYPLQRERFQEPRFSENYKSMAPGEGLDRDWLSLPNLQARPGQAIFRQAYRFNRLPR